LQRLLPINFFFIVFALFLAASRFGGIPLKSDARSFKKLPVLWWLLIIFLIEAIAGLFFLNILQASQLFLNADILILNFQIPSAGFILNLLFIKWGLFPFSLIALIAAGLAYVYYYQQQAATISHLLPSVKKTYYEVFIKRVVTGSLGTISNFVFIISISIGILTAGRLILSLAHIQDSMQLRVGSLVFFCVVTLLSAFKVIPWLALHFSRLFKSEGLAILCYIILALMLFLLCYFFPIYLLHICVFQD
jgi:choline-glycine betaine transporter